MIPVSIKIADNRLVIVWNNGQNGSIKLANLRFHCPCAICMDEKEKKGAGYIPFYNDNESGIADIKQVGSYAVAITWKDGHNTGIYNYDYLEDLIGNESK
jgi:DUF971 family protein